MTFLTSFARNKELAIHQLACAVVVHIARGQLSAGLKDILVNEKSTPRGVLMKGMVALLPVSMTRWTEAIGNQTAALSLSVPAGFKAFEPGDSLIQNGRDEKNCAPANISSCSE
ncbi:hypothetical protein KBY99_13420 [Cyanobium sp. Maggiore-St4-Cus]|uniref:hypothetical protein n=1 Tax=Cyanobium sp. Maggiore-St4-Cus TaxID=2823717 RepID=UPI0020CEA7FE|nr:hypothetical protein [Cyanobium sp. Maggiore-St4-Cus]MCP9789964.1 hypothetical protein [Cyanobium sp. Maggiore-St4-Cus]